MNTSESQLSEDNVIAATQSWIEKAVIGLNLCPFAKAVYVKKQIRYIVSHAETVEALRADLIVQLKHLVAAEPSQIDTTLLIHPWVLTDFLDYNDFLDIADATLVELDLDGFIQIASFHPHYQFADTAPEDISNYTNRSPFPILHLLRESSIDHAVSAFPDAAEIFHRNIQTMQQLGRPGWEALGLHTDASQIPFSVEQQKN